MIDQECPYDNIDLTANEIVEDFLDDDKCFIYSCDKCKRNFYNYENDNKLQEGLPT